LKKVAWSAGHSLNTAGKRSPNDEREWSFNNKVVMEGMTYLAKYEGVQQLRVDDSSGKIEIPLATRTNQANEWQANIYVSCHHNALSDKWGNHSGVETFVMEPASNHPTSLKLAKLIHPRIVKAMGITDRGVKSANFHELRETKMPAVLVEGGFMDSRIDIVKMRDDKFLKTQGEAIANGIVEYFGLKLKDVKEEGITLAELLKLSTAEGKHALLRVLKRFEQNEPALGKTWREKVENGTFTQNDSHEVLWVAIDRGYITSKIK
jgi:N-acetylmuramoyl-L-alanine amidase